MQLERALKEEILAGRLQPGERISVEGVASQWGTSTTPARDALKSLDATGFVHVLPRRGVYVAEMGPKKFRDVFELRIALEPLALRSAAPAIPPEEIEDLLTTHREAARLYKGKDETKPLLAIDTQIHDLIQRHCSNEILTRIMADLRDLILWAQRTVVQERPRALYESLCEHIALAEALVARDVDRAQAALEHHLVGVLERTLAAFRETGADQSAVDKDKTPRVQEAQQ